jgi:DNA-binding CsgD family transcriptional regulator
MLERPREALPEDLLRRGLFTECLSSSYLQADGLEARVRASLGLGRYNDALLAAQGDSRPKFRAFEAQALARLGAFSRASGIIQTLTPNFYDKQTNFEVGYAIVTLDWVNRDWNALEQHLRFLYPTTPTELGKWTIFRSWLAAGREQYVEQAKYLERAIPHFSGVQPDYFYLSQIAQSLTHLSRELYCIGIHETAVELVRCIEWPKSQDMTRFLSTRALAWSWAVRGNHVAAIRCMNQARKLCPQDWMTAWLTDRSYLALMAGEKQTAEACLVDAQEIADSTNWSSLTSEYRVSLLNLAQMQASVDVPAAQRCLQMFYSIPSDISPSLGLAHDRRLKTMEDYSLGCVMAASGDNIHAIQLLENVYNVFSSMRYAWRASAAALRLYKITDKDSWRERAVDAIQDFPSSSIANEIRKAGSGEDDPRFRKLTKAQRVVFTAVCNGLTNKQIAAEQNNSVNTINVHVKKCLLAFGVKSRAALMVEANKANLS